MKMNVGKYSWAPLACISLWSILLCAQSSDLAQNLADCKNGWLSCDRSRLSPSESADVALAEHRLNVRNCRNGYDSCDRSKLIEPEAIALADHQQNASPATNRSTTSIRLGGRAYLTIEYKDYQTTTAPPVKDSNSTVAGYR